MSGVCTCRRFQRTSIDGCYCLAERSISLVTAHEERQEWSTWCGTRRAASLSFTESSTPVRSTRSFRDTMVSSAQGVKPGRDREPQPALEEQSFRGIHGHFDTRTADVDARRSDDLHRPDPGRVVSGKQHDRPSFIKLGPPASPHARGSTEQGRTRKVGAVGEDGFASAKLACRWHGV